MITTVFFDLDGTLLPMDNDEFTKVYFKLLCKKLAPLGYSSEELVKAVWSGMAAMVKNDGADSNEAVFWREFEKVLGSKVLKDREFIDEFYINEFNEAKAVCGFDEKLVSLVHDLRSHGIKVVLATNPIFPSAATESRIRWAGFEPSVFEHYTTYENTSYCKPNPQYYQYLMEKVGVSPEECIMIGNDALEDAAAEEAGMKVFLLTDNLINKTDTDITRYPNGDVDALSGYLQSVI